jgi:pimeloyl-ACP methyl ester carboxylesterase
VSSSPAPDLELRTAAAPDSTGPPLLFVHGAYVGAWCWAEHFLPALADRGYTAHAVSLRGHGESGGRLATAGLCDFVADLRRVVSRLDAAPVLVGHSMGGVVVQRYLKQYDAPGAVLMASLPPQGMAGLTAQFAARDPALWVGFGALQTFGPGVASPRLVRRALLSDDVPDERLAAYASQVTQESPRALAELAGPVVTGSLPDVRTLVVGADEDAIVPRWAVEATARAFDTDPTFVPRVAHALMLDTGWERALNALVEWLDGHEWDARGA